MRPLLASALSLAAAFVTVPALADVPPPAGYVEQCTAAKQQKAGTECVSCGSYHGSVDKCPNLLSSSGFTKACQSRGASVWSEVWCRPAGGAALSPEAAKEVHAPTADELAAANAGPSPGHSGCAACDAAGTSGTTALGTTALVGLCALILFRRRRA